MLSEFIHEQRIAYFSMEIALRSEIPTYSGGLGILAGDTLRSAADLSFPMVAVSLISRHGYFHQRVDEEGRQTEQPATWDPSSVATPLGAKIAVSIAGRPVWVRGWLYVMQAHMSGREPIILLDTDLPENDPRDRELTWYLYGGDAAYRLKQEIILGIGGVRMLHALGFRILKYHMNEGHSALLTLELLNRYTYAITEVRPGESRYDIPQVRGLCNFTTHTPVEAGHDQFPYDLVAPLLDEFTDLVTLRSLAGGERLNMTQLALNMSEYVNGVAKSHAETSRHLFPGYDVRAITNGVHPFTWTSPSVGRLFDLHVPAWCHEPELLVSADRIPDGALWTAHMAEKRKLIEQVAARSGVMLNPETATIGYARRMTDYKRPNLLFTDIERLKQIAKKFPLQIIMAGKAHPRDSGGKEAIVQIHRHMKELKNDLPVVFLADYDMALAFAMVSGADIWLNTPLPPFEASGTSGMKAAFNGVPNLSVLDGWWVEGHIENITGWAIGPGSGGNEGAADDLYLQMEKTVLPLYYADRKGWIAVMKGAICRNAAFFNTHRMLRRYAADTYLH